MKAEADYSSYSSTQKQKKIKREGQSVEGTRVESERGKRRQKGPDS